MKKFFSLKSLVTITGIVAILWAASLALKSGKKKPQQVRPPVAVVSTKVSTYDVPLFVDAIGHCISNETVKIIPQVSGEVTRVHVQQGQHVSAGDVLFEIDSRTYSAALQSAEAELNTARAQLKIDSAQLERSKSLLPQNYISQQQYETYEAQVEQDIANVDAAEAHVKKAKIDLEHCSIISPINGFAGITSRLDDGTTSYVIDQGNIVTALDEDATLTVVDDVDTLKIEFSVSENHYYNLQKFFAQNDNQLNVEISSLADQSIVGNAKLTVATNAINAQTGNIVLRATMDNKDHKFWTGQSVKVRVLLNMMHDAILIPSEAVKMGQSGRYVFVIKEDKSVDIRPVEIGQIHGDMTVINNGLNDGDLIVQRGQLMLAPGTKVTEMPDTNTGVFKKSIDQNKISAEKNPTK